MLVVSQRCCEIYPDSNVTQCNIYGTVTIISSDPQCKKAMPDLQRYSYNLNLIKNVEENLAKVLNSGNFSVISYKQKMSQVIFAWIP